MTKKYEIVIYGATGYQGQLSVQYHLSQYGAESVRWAIAGRNRQKLEALRCQMGIPSLPIEVVDSSDTVAVEQLVLSTKVIVNNAAPYMLTSTNIVAACARHGTHYCDLSGELPWLRQMIDQHQDVAEHSGARILFTAGFESVPSDLGVMCLQRHAKERFGDYCVDIQYRLSKGKIVIGGGSYASGIGVMTKLFADGEIEEIFNNPDYLNPKDKMYGPSPSKSVAGLEYDPQFDAWIMPYFLGALDEMVVRRSQALTGNPYGSDFQYCEAQIAGKGVAGWLNGFKSLLVLAAQLGGHPNGLWRRFYTACFAPKPGEGPNSAEREKNGPYEIQMIGRTQGGQILKLLIEGDKDPGNYGTAAILGDVAMCLADGKGNSQGGCHTPSSAFDDHLISQLEVNAGLRFTLVDELPSL